MLNQKPLLPKISAELELREVVNEWIKQRFNEIKQWTWADEMNAKFRFVGKSTTYQLCLEGKTNPVWVVYHTP